ncbi:GlcG/HbpS family heme-binding protein [Saccharothrix sp. ALI-22-I]|uniref:GlcG/HbpS family heme-binding protein n=1 Tax=Saccharothrix sp. ALI-22-I TaxID=1933778 RepID=UPI0015C2EB6C|nr:heme-binding protein [Saccharothrix sp. ALI-22-I]
MTTTPTVSFRQARRALDAAVSHAEGVGAQVGIAIVDQGGHVRVLVRLDGANLMAADWALGKALTAAYTGMGTDDFGRFAAGNPAVLAAVHSKPGLNVLPGGVPIVVDGVTAGAVGIAGAPGPVERAIAEAAIAALGD